jgi:ribosomal protein L11 methyltransferase
MPFGATPGSGKQLSNSPTLMSITQTSSAGSESIFAVTIHTDPASAVILEELLAANELVAATQSDVDTDRAVLSVYCDDREKAETVEATVSGIVQDNHDILPDRISKPEVQAISRIDWAESWKDFFHTKRMSPRLTIKPSWETYEPEDDDECVIELDPGMSFGTGHHGTTQACLQYIDELAAKCPGSSFLDAGCGSGILSIAAARLGLHPVVAIDNDPAALLVAGENIGHNDCEITMLEVGVDTYEPQQPHGIVVANILADVLTAVAPRLVTYVAAGGHLILSGILTEQFEGVVTAYAGVGWREFDRKTIDEWTSGVFVSQ